ncbi:MAG: hypothetical protein ACYCY1_11485 [Sulfuriferula sp.]
MARYTAQGDCMSEFSKFLEAIKGFCHKTKSPVKPTYRIPTVEFDASLLTVAVKADIRKNVELLEGIIPAHFNQIYEATLRSVAAGRDLSLLSVVLFNMNIGGMTQRRAGQIALFLNNKATAVITRERQQEIGCTQAIWVYSGAPCEINSTKPTTQEVRRNAAHKAADGKSYNVSKGMFLNRKWTWPGYEDGCKCISRPIIPGFKYD